MTPPTNPAFQDYRLGDLATAPLFRRDHLGFRVEYPETGFTWSESASKLSKNQKRYGEEESASSGAGEASLPQRQVRYHSQAYPSSRPSGASSSEPVVEEDYAAAEAAWRAEQAEKERQATLSAEARRLEYHQQRQMQFRAPPPPPPAAAAAAPGAGRAILTSSLSESRAFGESATSTGRNPLLQPVDHLNQNLYPTPGFKASPFNSQFDAPMPR